MQQLIVVSNLTTNVAYFNFEKESYLCMM
jgi:hypothetical protein